MLPPLFGLQRLLNGRPVNQWPLEVARMVLVFGWVQIALEFHDLLLGCLLAPISRLQRLVDDWSRDLWQLVGALMHRTFGWVK